MNIEEQLKIQFELARIYKEEKRRRKLEKNRAEKHRAKVKNNVKLDEN